MNRTWTADEQKEHRRLWVEALRDGTRKQANGMLRKDGGYCCLGVACEISGLGAFVAYREGESYAIGAVVAPTFACLPPEVSDWLGIRTAGGVMADGRALFVLNDNGATFPELADIIEAEPAGLIADTVSP